MDDRPAMPMTHRVPARPALRARLRELKALRYAAVLAIAASVMAVINHVDDNSREAWLSQAEQIEEALNVRYEEPITYERAYLPADRGVRTATETIIVNGASRFDCTVELVKDNDDTVVDAKLVCESAITLTAETSYTRS